MAKKLEKPTNKSQKESAAQAAEDLKVVFPDVTIMVAGESIVVREYPFIKWLELKPNCGDLIESLSELVNQSENISHDQVLEFFETQFHEIEFLIRESINRDFEFLETLNDAEMQNVLFTWWRVNQHFFLRSAFRLVRTKIQTQSDGQQYFNASSATDTQK